ncbi:helix-turn-helix domain-containing protein [Streptomyces sp. NPDC058471]|uniref:helix-turn-helix domain-containing protein n=1 Tax=Streptomyces sp. NPDC058471 TaxID=3346516 RepID=UPI0036665279
MNQTQWKTRRTRKALGETVEASPEYVEAGYAFALAQAVYDRRTALGLSQADTAKRADMAQSQISAIEGGGSVPTLRLLNRLAKALESHLVIDLDEENPAFDFRPFGALAVQRAGVEQLVEEAAQVVEVQWADGEPVAATLTAHDQDARRAN